MVTEADYLEMLMLKKLYILNQTVEILLRIVGILQVTSHSNVTPTVFFSRKHWLAIDKVSLT